MFSINCLEITVPKEVWDNPEFKNRNRSIYKNLLSDNDYKEFNKNNPNHEPFRKRFFFNDFYEKEQYGDLEKNKKRTLPDNFFGDNINIQAIVGMNGSGKSTLMDLMYAAINNFCYMFERGNDRPGADPLYYVPNLYVNLFFLLPEEEGDVPAYLSCNDSSIFLYLYSKNEKKYIAIKKFSIAENKKKVINTKKGKRNWLESLIRKHYYIDIHSNNEYLGICNPEKIEDLVKNFFYTIVSNYSTQSFLYPNYNGEIYFHYGKNDQYLSEHYDKKDNASWINSLFHKNDGYVCPVVLNPYREWGKIDCVKEANLSIDRITALLIYERQQKNTELDFPKLFSPYTFKTLDIRLKKGYLLNKIIYLVTRYLKASPTQKDECIKSLKQSKNDFELIYISNKKLSDIIRVRLGISTKHKSCQLEQISFLYYQLKIIDIINKYTDYTEYRDCVQLSIDNNSKIIISLSNKAIFMKLINKLVSDDSHITKKLKRMDNFLFLTQLINTEKIPFERVQFYWFNYLKRIANFYTNRVNNNNIPTSYRSFYQIRNPFNHNGLFSSPMTIDTCLPPSIFEYDLILNKENNKVINYKQLSSGELQLFQTLSTHAYHIENLISIHTNLNNNRPKYHLINLVFDELEICFHPEYQRQFVSRLINMLNAIIFQKNIFFFNVFLITHSPFILSDIPSQRILYLNEGLQKNISNISPFAGNIGEMFYDSFFLKSTIGDFAETKIKSIVKEIKEKRMSANSPEVKSLISCIGDSVIKSLLSEIR